MDMLPVAYMYCSNCKKDDIPEANYAMHEVHCRSKIVLCPKCDEPIPKVQLDEHFSSDHAVVPCSLCKTSLEKRLLEDHQVDKCPCREVQCGFCELKFTMANMAEHADQCGSRTDNCEVCQRRVLLRDMAVHIAGGCQQGGNSKREATLEPAGDLLSLAGLRLSKERPAVEVLPLALASHPPMTTQRPSIDRRVSHPQLAPQRPSIERPVSHPPVAPQRPRIERRVQPAEASPTVAPQLAAGNTVTAFRLPRAVGTRLRDGDHVPAKHLKQATQSALPRQETGSCKPTQLTALANKTHLRRSEICSKSTRLPPLLGSPPVIDYTDVVPVALLADCYEEPLSHQGSQNAIVPQSARAVIREPFSGASELPVTCETCGVEFPCALLQDHQAFCSVFDESGHHILEEAFQIDSLVTQLLPSARHLETIGRDEDIPSFNDSRWLDIGYFPNDHRSVEQSADPISCQFCSRRFPASIELSRHQLVCQHPSKPFEHSHNCVPFSGLYDAEIEDDYASHHRGVWADGQEGMDVDNVSYMPRVYAHHAVKSAPELLPCQFCSHSLPASELSLHQSTCSHGKKPFFDDQYSRKPIQFASFSGLGYADTEDNDPSLHQGNDKLLKNGSRSPPHLSLHDKKEIDLPCEFCGQSVLASNLMLHQTACRPPMACDDAVVGFSPSVRQTAYSADNSQHSPHPRMTFHDTAQQGWCAETSRVQNHPVPGDRSSSSQIPGYIDRRVRKGPGAACTSGALLACSFCESRFPAEQHENHEVNCTFRLRGAQRLPPRSDLQSGARQPPPSSH